MRKENIPSSVEKFAEESDCRRWSSSYAGEELEITLAEEVWCAGGYKSMENMQEDKFARKSLQLKSEKREKWSGRNRNGRSVMQEMCKHAVDRSQSQLVDITICGFVSEELLEYIANSTLGNHWMMLVCSF
ncbi:unnamed protein product [Lactuca virosa]|uniref:Uncharacterized protein n=1 Tax=Lactuca virosa TaxID=75947 RepID=A0AAU9P4F2_9ASTR|nr:unnamed protein product [Lactuca virosa]